MYCNSIWRWIGSESSCGGGMSARTILVVLDQRERIEETIKTVACVFGPDGSRIVALGVTEVHPTLPLDRLPPLLDAPTKLALARAEVVALQFDVRLELH